jgi:hypothetical protein
LVEGFGLVGFRQTTGAKREGHHEPHGLIFIIQADDGECQRNQREEDLTGVMATQARHFHTQGAPTLSHAGKGEWIRTLQ